MLERRLTHKEIVEIKKEIKDIKTTQELSLRLESEKYVAYIDRVIGRSKEKALVFLAINGKDSLRDIASKTNLKQENVSRSKKALEKAGLIFKLDIPGRSHVYAKPRWIYILNIDEHVREKFGISSL